MKLIDKSALLAEIEKRKSEIKSQITELGNFESDKIGLFNDMSLYDDILSFINTLEVKEVDLEKKIQDYWNEHQYSHRLQKQVEDGFGESLIRSVAKHFFELGVNASNSLTWEDIKLIWNITDEMDNMPEEEFYKEVLKRFKAQKGE